jgi:hypothetical protein
MKYNWRLDIKEIEKLYNQGFSCSDIGKMLGASRQAVWEKMLHAKVETRKKKIFPYIIYDGIKFTKSEYGYYRATNRDKHISLQRYKWEKEVGKIPKGWDIHHKDRDKANNSLENLECLSKANHTKKHHNEK